jgi:hypothetical protein
MMNALCIGLCKRLVQKIGASAFAKVFVQESLQRRRACGKMPHTAHVPDRRNATIGRP